jgi:hypothetical protein
MRQRVNRFFAGRRKPLAYVPFGVGVLAVGFLTLGCRDPRPRALVLFDECLAGGIQSLRQGERRIEVDCLLQDPLLIVGLPHEKTTANDLMTAGLTREVAEMLATSGQEGGRWCSVEEFQYEPPKPNDTRTQIPIATTNCVPSDLEIQQIVLTRSSRVRLVMVKSESGQLMLDKLESL